MKNTISLCLFVLLFMGCSDTTFREGKIFAGGVYADAETLNLGKSTYEEYCFACHALNGDGNGVAAKGLYPPVRDFQKGIFKFGVVADGATPHDDQLKKMVREGLNGTAMLPWDMSEERLHAVVQYIKTFAPEVWEGKDKELGKKIKLNEDPWKLAHRGAAIEKGKEVYHFTAQCMTCHRGYLDVDEYNVLAVKNDMDTLTEFDSEYTKLKPQESDFGGKVIPPDFTWHEIRSANNVEEMAYRIAAGVGGVMPSWKDIIPDSEIWAVAYYVDYLASLKNTPARKELVTRIGK